MILFKILFWFIGLVYDESEDKPFEHFEESGAKFRELYARYSWQTRFEGVTQGVCVTNNEMFYNRWKFFMNMVRNKDKWFNKNKKL